MSGRPQAATLALLLSAAVLTSACNRRPSIARQPSTSAELVYSDAISANEQVAIELDTGVVYRFQVTGGQLYVRPRMLSGPAVHLAPLTRGGGRGTPFMAREPGEYVMYTARGGNVSVRIYKQPADANELACVRNPETPGCG